MALTSIETDRSARTRRERYVRTVIRSPSNVFELVAVTSPFAFVLSMRPVHHFCAALEENSRHVNESNATWPSRIVLLEVSRIETTWTSTTSG